MNDNDIMKAVGGIDPAFVAEANAPQKKHPIWRTVLPAAACLCLAIGGALLIKNSVNKVGEPDQQTVMNETEAALTAETNTAVDEAYTAAPTGESFGQYHQDEDGKKQIRTFITEYPLVGSEEHPLVPAGQCVLSPTLRAAMDEYGALDEYGNEIVYVVAVEIFDGPCEVIPCIGETRPEGMREEAERLFNEAGIVAELSKYFDGEETHWSMYLRATAEQLENFPADPSLGYWIMLRAEAFDEYGEPVGQTIFGDKA